MGWIVDGAYGHEGWVANVLADGRVASASTGGGVIVHVLTAEDIAAEREVRRFPNTDHIDVVIPGDQVGTWQATCVCGWTGASLPAYSTPAYPNSRDCPEGVEDETFAPAWREHVAPYAALSDLDELTDQLRDLEQRIAEKVQLARAGGASWSQVGRAAGLSKQGAQQRWGALTP